MSTISVFYSYSHRDEAYREELQKHLTILRRQGVISEWHDRKIGPGGEWEGEISANLDAADLILLLVSSDFLASEYCWGVELERAMKRHKEGSATVIPVIVRPVDLEGAPFMKLQALPTDARPVSLWPSHDEAWLDVARGVRRACARIGQSRSGPSIVASRELSSKELEDSSLGPKPKLGETEKIEAAAEEDSLLSDATSAELFGWRLSDAFPGLRGVEEIADPVQALDRLEVLLRKPLFQLRDDPELRQSYRNYPFWWFRGGSNMHIQHFERLGPDRALLDTQEFRPSRIVAVRQFGDPARDFVYVETQADEPSGAYQYAPGDIENSLKERVGYRMGAYVDEEYGLWDGRVITRAEYDDSAALIDGRPVLVSGARLRARYLTPYNFMLCGNFHVINQNEHDRAFEEILDGILRRLHSVDELTTLVRSLPKPPRSFWSQ